TCEAVITKSCFLLRNLPGAPAAVIENVAAGIFQVSFQLSTDTEGVKRQLRKYQDREIDLADACLIRMADQFGTGDILTLVVCPVYNFTEQPASFLPWTGWIRV